MVFILSFSYQVFAEEYKCSLSFGVFTKHFSGDHIETSRLTALSYRDWYIAAFNNSYGHETIFMGYGFKTKKLKNGNWWLRANLYMGLTYGYEGHVPTLWGIAPGLYPTGSLGWEEYSFELGVMPNGLFGLFKVEF